MAGPHTLPLHVGDYVKTTPNMGPATFEYHGIYIGLLFAAWNVPGCRLPTDDLWIARQLGCPIDFFREKVRPILVEQFKRRGKWWYQKRLSTVYDSVRLTSDKQRARAKGRKSNDKDHSRGEALPYPLPVEVHHQEPKPQKSGVGSRRGERLLNSLGLAPAVTIQDPAERLAIFQKSLAGAIGDNGYMIVQSAVDPLDPFHARSLALCRATAKKLGKGWPQQWPKSDA